MSKKAANKKKNGKRISMKKVELRLIVDKKEDEEVKKSLW
jgi:translation initiation factor IF-3